MNGLAGQIHIFLVCTLGTFEHLSEKYFLGGSARLHRLCFHLRDCFRAFRYYKFVGEGEPIFSGLGNAQA